VNQVKARRRIWERLATTARHDIDNADWVWDESEDQQDHERLFLACEEVAAVIDRKLKRGKK